MESKRRTQYLCGDVSSGYLRLVMAATAHGDRGGKPRHELSALEGLGLSDIEIDASLTYVLGFVQGWARTAADASATQDNSGVP